MSAFFANRGFSFVDGGARLASRALMIVVIILNALGPTAATAMSIAGSDKVDSSSTISGSKGSVTSYLATSPASPGGFQDGTLTVPAIETATETASPEPTGTASPDATRSLVIPTVSAETTPTTETAPTSLTTLQMTPTPSAIQTVTQSLTAVSQPPALLFRLSVSPEQAAPGDEVTFTIEIINNGQAPVTGLLFSNTLPADLGNGQHGVKDFRFDLQTRLLTWDAVQAGIPTLAPGQRVNLTYTARVTGQRDEVQLIDSATLKADGFAEALLAEAALTLLAPQKRLTILGSQGGKALGLNGRVQVNLPQNALNAPRGLLVQDLNEGVPPAADQPWTKFALEMRLPKPENAQPLISGSAEQDRVIPFETVEAQFDQPVEIAISFDGLADLSTLGADKTPFLVTLDEESGTWARIPLRSIDRSTNQIKAEITHFSIWGVGIGPSFPTNGANILLFDNAYSDLFTGRSRYSMPLWVPPGRNGMAPSLALSYSSGVADGILGDIQASWTGLGWSIDSVEIARKITNGGCNPCGGGSYGYENKFLLLFQGTGYELLPDISTKGRYHTKSESFLYIQLHSNNLGNNSPVANNSTSEWWEVVQRDGTRWRLGWTSGSEQLAAMKGYPGGATGAWYTLGYAGSATNVVTSRWRADQVTDVYGNRMTFTYFEEQQVVAGTSASYDRASYVDTIAYTSHTSGTPAAGYSVVFVRGSRAGSDVPASPTEWDNWDTYRLDRIEVKYGTTVVRTYDFGYVVGSYSDGGVSWQTTKLISMAVSGTTTVAPMITFSYLDLDNRAANGTGSNEWPYPRLASVANGWGATSSFSYESDGRGYTSWYNWRITALDVSDGVNTSPMKTVYAYTSPCYNDATAGWCNTGNIGELIGYGQTSVTTKDFGGVTTLGNTIHKFHTDERKAGREYESRQQKPDGTILSQTNTTFVVYLQSNSKAYFTVPDEVDEYRHSTIGLVGVSGIKYWWDWGRGLLTGEWHTVGPCCGPIYKEISYEYVTNTNPSVWILDTLSARTVSGIGPVSREEYGYNGNLPGVGSPTKNKPDLVRVVSGTQTIDKKYIYDTYGNVTATRLFKAYGTTSSQPSSTYLTYLTGYDTSLKTYVTSTDPPLLPATISGYDFGLGLPTTVIDANGNTTTTAYDGLGRVISIKYPGSAQQSVKYTYPSPPFSVPFGLKAEVWDQTTSSYLPAWQIMDGLGRVIQTQSPFESPGSLVLTDTSYNAVGLIHNSGLRRTLNATGGSYFAPNWGSVPHTATSYDALGRASLVDYPDGTSESFSYSATLVGYPFGTRVTSIDRNNHQKVHEYDFLGLLIKIEEYTGSGTYNLYATTTYQYNTAYNALTGVTDAAGNQTTIGYDGFGRKISMSDPDLGSWSYTYDVFGNLNTQTDARGCVTTITYDDLNRPKLKSYTGPGACDSTPDVTFTYDSTSNGNEGVGRRTAMSDINSSTTWFYNVLGQITSETHTLESTNYRINTSFDAFGRILSQTRPSQGGTETLTYSYNAMGALSSLVGASTYLSQIHYAASGQIIEQLLGNGLRQQFCYSPNTLRLAGLRVYPGTLQSCVSTPSTPRLNLSYAYQNNGNVSQIIDATRSETLTYTYDELDRLDTVSGPYSHNYDYNTIGNLTNKNTATYNYADTAHKHAVTGLGTGESYTYDANGNMITRVEGGLTYTQTFDAENRLISVAVNGQTTRFVYEGDGNLVKKIKADGSRTLYVGGLYEVDKNSGGSVTTTRTYYPAAGAMRIGSTLYYMLKDHLGSATVVTNTSGIIVGEDRFFPFGETRFTTGTMFTDKLFTGQREITGLGIYHFGARFYSPRLGRFLSADTVVPDPANPQNLNRFSYVHNNPLKYIDPTGHRVCDDFDTVGGCYTAPGSPAGGSGGGTTYVRPRDGGGSSGSSGGGGVSSPLPSIDLIPVGNATTGDDTPITNLLLQLPGSDESWSTAATVVDGIAWMIDVYSVGVVTYGGIAGAGIPAAVFPPGTPEVPVVTGLAGVGIAELYVQPALRLANNLALLSTGLTFVSDTKAGNTRIEQGIFGNDVTNSFTLTMAGFQIPEAYTSLIIQSIAVANDLGWTSLPWPDPRSQP